MIYKGCIIFYIFLSLCSSVCVCVGGGGMNENLILENDSWDWALMRVCVYVSLGTD